MTKANKTLEYLSNTTGSGKTEYITDMIMVNTEERYLVVAPNRELCTEIEVRLKDKNISDMVIINQLTTDKPVRALKIELCDKSHRVIVTTQAAFQRALVEGVKFKKDWNLVLDEDFSPLVEHEIFFTPSTIGILNTCFDFSQSEIKDDYLDISPNGDYLDEVFIKKTTQDSFLNNKSFRRLVGFAYSKAYHTHIDKSHGLRIEEFSKPDTKHKGLKFYAVSLIDVEEFFLFKSVMVSSSCYEHSLSYKLFKSMGVQLVQIDLDDEVVCSDFSHVTIKYYTDKNWSSLLRKTQVTEKHTMESLIHETCINDIGGEEFIFNANMSYRDKVKGGKLVTSIHGVNKYIKYKNMLYMPSLNASGDLVRFLSHYDITRKDIDFDRNVLSAFQFVSRGAVRDRNNIEEIRMYVMDRRTAVFLNDIFPKSVAVCANIHKQKKKVPDNVKSFVCRVKRRINNKELVRDATIQKFALYMNKYYDKKILNRNGMLCKKKLQSVL